MTAVLALALVLAEPLWPPAWDALVTVGWTFEADAPEILAPGLEVVAAPRGVDGGLHGRAGEGPLRLRGDGLSPHRPLAVLLWWCLVEDLPPNGGYHLASLHAGQGFISTFARGGPWCGLSDTAAVTQVWDLPGISPVNALYDLRPRANLDLRAGAWHHTALLVTAASRVAVWTDGRRVFETRAQGRDFVAADSFETLTLGGDELRIDDLLVLRRVPPDGELADYVAGLTQRRRAYPAP